MRTLEVRWLGTVPYREAWSLQKSLVEARAAGALPDTLLLLEHPSVITLGRSAGRESLLFDEASLAARGVELVESDRGGDATWHGPGQLVGYPVLDLRPDWQSARRYVWALEQTLIDVAGDLGLVGHRLEGAPGVWLGDPWRKFGAIGARIHRWITFHGFALNVDPDLAAFDLIVPCGIRDKGVTSLAAATGRRIEVGEVIDRTASHLARILGRMAIRLD